MKILSFILLVLTLHLRATTYSQKVTLSLKEAGLPKVFKSIRQQTGYNFFYKSEWLKNMRPVTIKVENASIEEALNICFKNQSVTFELLEKSVVIKPTPDLNQEENNISRSVLISKNSFITIIGRIVDMVGNPLSGATIRNKNNKNSTQSDNNGKFSIKGEIGDIIEVSYVGYMQIDVSITDKNSASLLLKLTTEIASLNEVVVNKGYYTEKKKFNTGNVVTVSAKDIEQQPVTSPLMALQGRMAGVDITPASGVPGSFTQVVIRGRNSISNTNATPLYIIDGIPVNSSSIQTNNNLVVPGGFDPLSTINSANIERIDVLKDADATAIYGSRGANGVILITTKRGRQTEKTNLDINFYIGAAKIPRFLDLLTTPQYVALRTEALSNANTPIDAMTAPDLVVWDTTRFTNWQKKLLSEAANVTDLQANISSGNAFTRFRFGASYHNEDLITPGDFSFRRVTGNFSLNHNSIDKKFSATLDMNYGAESNKLFAGTNPVYISTILPPNAPELYDTDGNLNWENSTFANPLAGLRSSHTNKGTNLILNSVLGYEFIPGLSLRINLGYNLLNRNSIAQVKTFSAMDPATITDKTTAKSLFEETNRNSWIIEPQALYHKRYNEINLNVVVGTTWQQSGDAYQLVEASGYTSDVQLGSLKGATKTTYLTDGDSYYRYMAVFGRIGLDYKDNYVLNLTGRRDGSSRFGPDSRWGNFGAIGAAWIFSQEDFMKYMSFLSFGKLRGSYGVTGSDQVSDYQYFSVYDYTPYSYQDRVNLLPTYLANRSYAWEQTIKLEMALELSFLRDRIHFEATFYRNRCSNQLVRYQLPGTTGFSGVTQNLGATVENKGLELSLQSVNINRSTFQWRSTFNFTLPTNKLLSYPGIEESPYANTYAIGEPLTIVKLFNYIAVNPTTGLYEVKDVDGNGIFDTRDQTFIQNIGRRYYGGLTNMFSYNGLELSFLLQFSQQTSYNVVFVAPGSTSDNLTQEVANNYWRKQGDFAKYQKATTQYSDLAGISLANQSNAAYISSAFIRLKTLSLSYTLSPTLLDKAGFKAGKIFLQGQNLATFSNFPALDPESTIRSLPPLLMINVGLELKL